MDESHTGNLTLNHDIVKGKYFSRTIAIEEGKLDSDGTFTLVKNRHTGLYGYIPGNTSIIPTDYTPQADYYRSMRGGWRHINRSQA